MQKKVKMSIFLAGKPNIGIGSIDKLKENQLSVTDSFYHDEAKRAIEIGVSFDIIIFNEKYSILANYSANANVPNPNPSLFDADSLTTVNYYGLNHIHYLTTLTGGNILIYSPSRSPFQRDLFVISLFFFFFSQNAKKNFIKNSLFK